MVCICVYVDVNAHLNIKKKIENKKMLWLIERQQKILKIKIFGIRLWHFRDSKNFGVSLFLNIFCDNNLSLLAY